MTYIIYAGTTHKICYHFGLISETQWKEDKASAGRYFRSLSHQLFNTEDKHYTVRATLVRFENFNGAVFSKYLMTNNEPTISQHIKAMGRLGTWATQLEVIAASSFFQIPFYYLRRLSDADFHWEVMKPISTERLRFPPLVDSLEDFPQPANNLTHFELLYLENTHYDSLIDAETHVPCRCVPALAPRRQPLEEKRVSNLVMVD